MEPGSALRGRKRTSLEVKSEAWAVLLSCESFAQASQGGGFRPGDVYEGHFKEHLDRTNFFHRLGMLRAEGFFYLDGRQKSPETKYFFLKDRVKLHRKVRDTWFPKGVVLWPPVGVDLPSAPLFDAPGPEKRDGGFTNVMVETYPPIKPRENTEPEPAYQAVHSGVRATYFSCPLCGSPNLVVKHSLKTTELEHLFDQRCHSAFLVQCCCHPSHFFMIAFGENSQDQQVVKVLLPGEW